MTTPHDRNEPTVDPKLLEILVCPVTKGPLEYDAARQELVSRAARLAATASRSCCRRKPARSREPAVEELSVVIPDAS